MIICCEICTGCLLCDWGSCCTWPHSGPVGVLNPNKLDSRSSKKLCKFIGRLISFWITHAHTQYKKKVRDLSWINLAIHSPQLSRDQSLKSGRAVRRGHWIFVWRVQGMKCFTSSCTTQSLSISIITLSDRSCSEMTYSAESE